MKKVVHKIINSERGEYVFRSFHGDINTEDIMDSFVYILNNNMISKACLGILTDLHDSNMNMDMQTFKSLLIYIKSSPKLTGLKIAVVVDSADKIVFPMMASNEPGIMVQPFSTIKAAEDWIVQ
jgi:hypothetical protein